MGQGDESRPIRPCLIPTRSCQTHRAFAAGVSSARGSLPPPPDPLTGLKTSSATLQGGRTAIAFASSRPVVLGWRGSRCRTNGRRLALNSGVNHLRTRPRPRPTDNHRHRTRRRLRREQRRLLRRPPSTANGRRRLRRSNPRCNHQRHLPRPARPRHVSHRGASRARQRCHRRRRRNRRPLPADARRRPPRLRQRHERDALGLSRADGSRRRTRIRDPSTRRTGIRATRTGTLTAGSRRPMRPPAVHPSPLHIRLFAPMLPAPSTPFPTQKSSTLEPDN
jgi:hypothetical protein